MKSKRITYIAILSAVAIVFGYIESLFPIPIAIPGVKLGLSNIVLLVALTKLYRRDAFLIMLIKVSVSSLLFSGFTSFIYSLLGGVLSIIAMSVLLNFKFNLITASIAGGIFHNLGQITAAAIMLSSFSAFYYLPVLIFSGIIVGFIIGILSKAVTQRIN